MMEHDLNKESIAQTLGFHGLPLIKTWNEENGMNSLSRLGLQLNNIDTAVYHERLKVLNFSDRTKRLRLHRFICNKSESLFKSFKENPVDRRIRKSVSSGGDSIPPFEFYANIDKDERLKRIFTDIQVGDIVYCCVTQTTRFGLLSKVLCTTGTVTRLVPDLNVKGVIATQNLISALDAKNVSRQFIAGDLICCEVVELCEHPQLNLGMRGVHQRHENGPPLGLISSQQLPQFYKIAIDHTSKGRSYNETFRDSDALKNPAIIENLYVESGLKAQSHYSFMSSSKSKFPQDEYAKDLRQLQASKLAFRSVAEGIEHFKEGRHTEAFQCLNKALSIDPRNVEGLVARGALYANSGSFKKAIVDFEAALKLNGSHANAKKYLGETLLALGRNFEEENKFEEARKAYIDCLKINPHHQEALASLEYLKTKLNAKKIVEPAELELPPLNIGSLALLKDSKSSRDFQEGSKKEKKSKKDKKRKGKKRHSSSSESSSDSSDSSDSSSESSDNSSSSNDSDSNSRSKKKEKKRHEKSLSPLSKRMDLADSSYQFNQSFDAPDDHELKVRKFLEMGRDEDDYEDRVRQLMAETSKYQKSKQAEEAKSAKKKKKSEKKMKREKKKRKKEEKKKSKGNEIDNLREALKMFENLPEFSKFQKLYNDKIKEEEMKQKHAENDDGAPEKWKMKFAKDERQGDPKQKAQGKQQFGFNYESDEEDQVRNFQGQVQAHAGSYPAASTSGLYDKIKKQRSPPPKPKLEVAPVPAPIVPKGPVVLDKFGNFRLAELPGQIVLPPKPLEPTSSTRRSRSNSRSPRRRRRSGSYRRRYSRSRSYSRSYSRSRSRSRGRRNFRGRGGFNQRPRFSPKRMNQATRGRWNDNFRDSRDFRGGRADRFNNRDRPSNRGGRFGRFNRSFSRSPERSPDSRNKEHDDRRHKDREGRWAEEDSVGKPDLDEMEEMLKKARKEKLDDMMERNKDLVAKR